MYKAINPKYQAMINRLIKHDRYYVTNYVDSETEHKAAAINRYDAMCDVWADLPKREQANFDKQYKIEFGYTCQMSID